MMRKRREFLATLMSLVLCLAMMLSSVGNITVAKAATTSDDQATVSDKQNDITFTKSAKWIDANGNKVDNNDLAAKDSKGNALANLTLSVEGDFKEKVETTKGNLDVVLLIDRSGSMNDKLNGQETSNDSERRLTYAKTSAKKFLNDLFDTAKNNKEIELNVELVTFGQYATASENKLTSANYENEINSIKAGKITKGWWPITETIDNGGTNLQAGLHKANERLQGGGQLILRFL